MLYTVTMRDITGWVSPLLGRVCLWFMHPVEHLIQTRVTHHVSNPGEGIKVKIFF